MTNTSLSNYNFNNNNKLLLFLFLKRYCHYPSKYFLKSIQSKFYFNLMNKKTVFLRCWLFWSFCKTKPFSEPIWRVGFANNAFLGIWTYVQPFVYLFNLLLCVWVNVELEKRVWTSVSTVPLCIQFNKEVGSLPGIFPLLFLLFWRKIFPFFVKK